MRRSLVSAVALLGTVASVHAQDSRILPAGFDFTAKEVFFQQPVTYRDGQLRTGSARIALKIVIRGEDFSEGSRGPIFFVGKLRADHHVIAPDGRSVAVYLYGPRRLPARAPIVIQRQPGDAVQLRRSFDVRAVKWLPRDVRERHQLPRFE